MGRVRERVLKSVSSEKARRQIFTKLAKSNIINLLKKGNMKRFYKEIESILRMR
jgi:siroheme synthase (precorrin-2 oxidase/ferrochelatase)